MPEPALTPSAAELHLEHLSIDSGQILVVAHAKRAFAHCPSCMQASRRIHSRYVRCLTDLPWHGVPVHIELHTRRFFCDTPACERRIFTERLPETTCSRARHTCRLLSTHRLIALALGGQAGARLARELGLLTSADTLLRRLKTGDADPERPTPRCLGVDDWAWRKGKRYGTLLCDLERGGVVDLLPERSAEALERWLKAHPGVEVISRDRAGVYAEGARRGAPHARQVADRWHLQQNLTEVLQKLCQARHAQLREAALRIAPGPEQATTDAATPAPSAEAERAQRSREHRLACYTELVRLLEAGHTHEETAAHLGISTRTVTRWVAAGAFPERRAYPPQPSIVDPYRAYLQKRIREGEIRMTQLLHEIQAQGYGGGKTTLWTYLQTLRPEEDSRPSLPVPPAVVTPRRCAWLLRVPEEKRSAEERVFLRALESLWPECKALTAHAQEFIRLFRERDGAALDLWLDAASAGPLARFVHGLRSDLKAVRAAVTEPWSNGPTEGQVNRLKMLKRQMYGRAGVALLRARVLAA